MPGKIFVNYRRDDSAANALSIAQYLERTFGARNVFLDIDRIRAGQNFPTVLEEKLADCKVMLAVIGPSWLTLKDDNGLRRIDDPHDWVRLEITRALARGVTVIPVLVAGASLPKKADLPAELQPLVERHAAIITTNGFRNEMAGLERDIRALDAPRGWGRIAAGVVGLTAIAATAGWFALHPPSMSDTGAIKPAAEVIKPAESARQEVRKAEAETPPAKPPATQDTQVPVLQPPPDAPKTAVKRDTTEIAAVQPETPQKPIIQPIPAEEVLPINVRPSQALNSILDDSSTPEAKTYQQLRDALKTWAKQKSDVELDWMSAANGDKATVQGKTKLGAEYKSRVDVLQSALINGQLEANNLSARLEKNRAIHQQALIKFSNQIFELTKNRTVDLAFEAKSEVIVSRGSTLLNKIAQTTIIALHDLFLSYSLSKTFSGEYVTIYVGGVDSDPLTQRRARAVTDYLAKKGLDKKYFGVEVMPASGP